MLKPWKGNHAQLLGKGKKVSRNGQLRRFKKNLLNDLNYFTCKYQYPLALMRIIATCWVILTLTREVGHLKLQHNGYGQWFTPSVVGGTTGDLLSDGTSTQGALMKLKKKKEKKEELFRPRHPISDKFIPTSLPCSQAEKFANNGGNASSSGINTAAMFDRNRN